MKPTPELLKRVISQIEILLDVRKGKELPSPNIPAAIHALEQLELSLAEQFETPVDVLGLTDWIIAALENAGIKTAEQLEKMTFEELVKLPRIDKVGALEIQGCLEIWREWE